MWKIANTELNSRFLLGSSNYASFEQLANCIKLSNTQVVTVSLKRAELAIKNQQSTPVFFELLQQLGCKLLPNTAGCYSAQQAVATAILAREMFATNWIKLEVIGDDLTLHPNLPELIVAAGELIKLGFEVFPYCTSDVVICKQLINVGCKILMPMAAPIGSGMGIVDLYSLKQIRDTFPHVNLIIDAGIGRPSDAVIAMEHGYDGILLNTAVSHAINPEQMALAFAQAIQAGRVAYKSGIMPKKSHATPSTMYWDRPFQDDIRHN
jgi:thiazole synthase